MYTSDLTSLLGMLKETRANGVISSEGTGPGELWQAQLTLFEGQVTTCHVQTSVHGQSLFTDGAAIRWLASLGNLTWKPVASTPQQASLSVLHDSQAVLFQASEVPRRLAQVEQGAIHSWSRKQRQVFALVDGRRSAERIAVILRQPLNVVEDILHDLQSRGVIAVDKITGELREEEGIT
jgi:hypothetical protein